jgi:integrase
VKLGSEHPRPETAVLSRAEVLHFLGCVADIKHQAILTACYAAGLRISEAVRLKATSLDNQRMVIRIERGNLTFHTAASTAFPQPAPDVAPAPGPMEDVLAGELHKYLGIRTVNYVRGKGAPALTDSTLVAF